MIKIKNKTLVVDDAFVICHSVWAHLVQTFTVLRIKITPLNVEH